MMVRLQRTIGNGAVNALLGLERVQRQPDEEDLLRSGGAGGYAAEPSAEEHAYGPTLGAENHAYAAEPPAEGAHDYAPEPGQEYDYGYAAEPTGEQAHAYGPTLGAENHAYAAEPPAEGAHDYAPEPGQEYDYGYAAEPPGEAQGYAPQPELAPASASGPAAPQLVAAPPPMVRTTLPPRRPPQAPAAPGPAAPQLVAAPPPMVRTTLPPRRPPQAPAAPGPAAPQLAAAVPQPAAAIPQPAAAVPQPAAVAAPAPAVPQPAAPAAQGGAAAASPKQALNLLSLQSQFLGEMGAARGGLDKVVRGEAGVLRMAYARLQALRAVAPGDAAGLAAFIGNLPATLRGELAGADYAKTLAGMTTLYNRQLAKVTRQEMPVSPEGVVDEAALSARVVEYDVGGDAQQRTRVNINGGQLMRNGPPFNTGLPVDTRGSVTQHSGPGWEIFVVSPTGDIHMDSHKIGKYHHSSLLGGGAVSMGGEMLVVGGTIQMMSNKSGHYLPSKVHFRQFLHRLKKQGVPLTFQIAAGFGVAAGPAAALEAGGGRETYHAQKLAIVLESLKAQHGAEAVRDALTKHGWQELSDGSVQDSSGVAVADKLVLNVLKQELGKAKSKVTETNASAVKWV